MVRRLASSQEVFQEAALTFVRCLQDGPADGQGRNVALCGGRSIVSFLREVFSRRELLSIEQWRGLHFFLVDERLVPQTHEESNFRLIDEGFFQALRGSERALLPEQIHPLRCEFVGDESGVEEYGAELKRCGGRFDVAVVSAGEDGHIAGLFPEHPSFRSEAKLFLAFQDSPKPPPARMSASRRLLLQTPHILGLVLGEAKRGALDRYQESGVTPEQCPLKLLDESPNGVIFTDLSQQRGV